ncbi:MAG: hypothetical protein GWO20_02975, partial [Candidatus Korarchaeota archaeon]|nr:hypothetical protein [Candidatus Korarchaeota archaeon]
NFKQRQKTEQKIVSEKEDFQTTKRLWGTFLKTILFRVSEPAEKLLSRLESNPDHAKTKAELAEQMGYSTRHIGRIIEELDEAQLINQRKRQKEGPGRLAWEYWKTKTPGINKVKLISDISDPLFEGSEKKNSESKTPKKRVKNVRNSGQNNSDINDTTSMSTKEKFSESETEKNHVTNVQNSGKYSLCINCGEPIHPDDPDTFYEGEHMHLKCYHKLMKGRR